MAFQRIINYHSDVRLANMTVHVISHVSKCGMSTVTILHEVCIRFQESTHSRVCLLERFLDFTLMLLQCPL